MKFLINFYQNIKSREGFQKILKNTLWLFYDRFFRLGFSLIVGAFVARYLAPELYGKLNYAISFVSLMAVLGTLGLDNILIRDMVKAPDEKNSFLGTAFVLKLTGSFIIVSLSSLLIFILNPNDILLRTLVFITASGYIFQSINVIDLFFQSGIRSKYTVISNNIAFIISSAAKITFILLKASVVVFAVIAMLEIAIANLGLIFFYYRKGHAFKNWKFDQQIALRFLKDSWPLILSGAAIMIYMRIDQVMIGNMLGNTAVGIYSSAVKISEVWYFIPGAFISSVYPKIVEAKNKGKDIYYSRIQQLFNIMAILGYTAAFIITFFAHDIIYLIYGRAYIPAANILIVHIWCGLFMGLGVARGSWLISENITAFQLVSMTVGSIVNVVLNLFLIKKYGGVGAAYATLVAQILVSYLATIFVSWNIFKMQTKALLFNWGSLIHV